MNKKSPGESLQIDVIVILLATVTLFLIFPLNYYASNPYELPIFRSELLLVGSSVALAFALLLSGVAALLWLIPRYPAQRVLRALCVMVTAGMWFQSRAFRWKGGTLDGRSFDWSVWGEFKPLEATLWLLITAVVILVVIKRPAMDLLKVQAIVTLIALGTAMQAQLRFSEADKVESYKYMADKTAIYHLSSQRNMFVFVLDESQNDVAEEILTENAELRKAFKDFVLFRNHVGAFQSTIPAMPATLTGIVYNNDVLFSQYLRDAYLNPDSLYRRMKRAGNRVSVIPWYPHSYYTHPDAQDNIVPSKISAKIPSFLSLLDLSLFAAIPSPLKQFVYQQGAWLLSSSEVERLLDLESGYRGEGFPERLEKVSLPSGHGDSDAVKISNMIRYAKASVEQPSFFSLHFKGPHNPFNLDVDGNRLLAKDTAHTRKHYKQMFTYKLRLMASYLEMLRQTGLYDSSSIILMGDHGSGRSSDTMIPPKHGKKPLSILPRGHPMLLVKGANAKHEAPIFSDQPTWSGSFTAHFEALISSPEHIPDESNVVRRYVTYKWQRVVDDNYLSGYSEFAVIGPARDDDSWFPVHLHEGGKVPSDCPFAHGTLTFERSNTPLLQKEDGTTFAWPNSEKNSFVLLRFELLDDKFRGRSQVKVTSVGQNAIAKTITTDDAMYQGYNIGETAFTEGIIIPSETFSAGATVSVQPAASHLRLKDLALLKPR